MRPDNAIYIGQRRSDGSAVKRRPMVWRDAQDGRGPRRMVSFTGAAGQEISAFDWGQQCSPHRAACLAYALLADALEDHDWARQLEIEYAMNVIRHLPHDGWRMTVDRIKRQISMMEQGLKVAP